MYTLTNYITDEVTYHKTENTVEPLIQVYNLDGDYWELERGKEVIDFRGK